MINWLTDNIGTGAYLDVVEKDNEIPIVDVRNLVDKDGNSASLVREKIDEALGILKTSEKVIICCDYGMSRSNSIAAGIISRHFSIPFSEAVRMVINRVTTQGIKVEVLDMVHKVLSPTTGNIDPKSAKVLVTGSSGFIGKELMVQLKAKVEAIGITTKDFDLVKDSVSLDLLIKEKGITALVHLANPRVYTLNSAMGESLVMLKNVIEVCRLNNVKLIYLSSWEVYSAYKGKELLADENLPMNPKGAYGESKWFCEMLIEHYHRQYGLEYVILRSSPVYGEGSDRPKFIYNFIDLARNGLDITTHEYINGHPKLDLLHLDDLIDAVIKAMDYQSSGTFNIGSGVLRSTRETAESIVDILGTKSKVKSNFIETYYPNVQIDFQKAKEKLRWQPHSDFAVFIMKILTQA